MKFLPMRLAALPKAFGLKEKMKGYFPHFFNTPENQEYIGTLPTIDMYGCNKMRESERCAFMKWYEIRRGFSFNFREEIEAYCRSDVDILQSACSTFKNLITDISKDEFYSPDGTFHSLAIDPFQHLTIASVCMAIYQFCFLKDKYLMETSEKNWIEVNRVKGQFFDAEGQLKGNVVSNKYKFLSSPIAIINPHNDTHSKLSIEWLEYLAEKDKIHIKHALNGGEVKHGKYKFDGFCTDNNTVYEFYGCLWHGDPHCYPHTDRQIKHPHTGQSMRELYRLTKEKESYIIDHGFKLCTIWEHEFIAIKNNDITIQKFLLNKHIKERLNPRDAFFGGRTSVLNTYYKTNHSEEIHYVDFCSLYPFINGTCKYPIGHPETVTNNFPPLENVLALVQADVLPPQHLLHPVLPYRSGKTLMFPLCRTCATNKTPKCSCVADARMLSGTWTSMELNVASRNGYQIKKIYEMKLWRNSTTELFKEYVHIFSKLKMEATGWPDWVKTETDKSTFICNYYQKTGVKLDRDNMRKNPGLRSVAKLCMNSLWGKFAQRSDLPKSVIAKDLKDLLSILVDQSKRVDDFHTMNNDLLHVGYSSNIDQENYNTNIYIAIFTTAYARLKLLAVLHELGSRALYCDTDSVIYVCGPNDKPVALGDCLGDLTNELKPDDHIVEFCAVAPKHYAFRTKGGHVECKVKGFSLDYDTAQDINFESVRSMIQNKASINTIQNRIVRDKYHVKVINKVHTKHCNVTTLNKRALATDNRTYPYGYKLE